MKIHDALDDGESELRAAAIQMTGRRLNAVEHFAQFLPLNAAVGVARAQISIDWTDISMRTRPPDGV